MEEPELLTTYSSDSYHSPEFEFWMLRSPTFPEPDLPSADELFSHGILLPLHPFKQNFLIKTEPESSGSVRPAHGPLVSDDPIPPSHKTEPESSGSGVKDLGPGPEVSAGEFTSSKRWKDIFKKNSQTTSKDETIREKEKKKKEKKCGGVVGGMSTAELNINIWPFSRSRSAGNGGNKPRVVTRKVNSAPCSRSNSAGESRKSPGSPSRSGVHLGRSSPVWQVRRSESYRKMTSTTVAGGAKARVLKLNVPMCIGYRQNSSVCRSDEMGAVSVAAVGGGGAVRGNNNNLFNIRNIFTKKVH